MENQAAFSRISRIQLCLSLLLGIVGLTACGGTSTSNPPPPPPNPVPSISSLSPSSASAGGAAFTLVVNGGNFISTSAVQWNGSSKTTSYFSEMQLTAAISAADLAVQGTSNVTVVNPAPGGGTSPSASFDINGPIEVSIDAQSPALATVNKDVFGVNLTSSMDLTNGNSNYNATIATFKNASFGMGGDPNEAAAWVDYANNQMHYGIKYWSIGNEQYYGSPTLGATLTTPDFNVSPSSPGSLGSTTYANLITTQFYPLMKAMDPSIQIGVDLVVPENNASSRTMP
jgi:IPT/TIG domain